MALSLVLFAVVGCRTLPAAGQPGDSTWQLGAPITRYHQGPGAGSPPRFEAMSPAVAKKLAAGGFNLVWCQTVEHLDAAYAAGVRGLVHVIEDKPPWRNLMHTDALDDPAWLARIDALIESVKDHPATYAYVTVDEPSAAEFPALGKLVAYIRARDPKHLVYINLFPTYASAAALGTSGDTVTAYREYLRQFVDIVDPDLISYDHYQMKEGTVTLEPYDTLDYFLNLALVREAALEGGVPFLNVVQACALGPGSRTPNGDEGRYLAYTTLAYGGQGISQFVYNAWEGAKHWGGVENPDRTLTPLGEALRRINPEFVAIGTELQPLTSLGAYHLGVIPNGASGLPPDAVITVDPPIAAEETKGLLLGYFGIAGSPTHVLVVNLDYTRAVTTTVVGPGPMDVFDTKGWYAAAGGARAQVRLPAGGGKLLRLRAQ